MKSLVTLVDMNAEGILVTFEDGSTYLLLRKSEALYNVRLKVGQLISRKLPEGTPRGAGDEGAH